MPEYIWNSTTGEYQFDGNNVPGNPTIGVWVKTNTAIDGLTVVSASFVRRLRFGCAPIHSGTQFLAAARKRLARTGRSSSAQAEGVILERACTGASSASYWSGLQLTGIRADSLLPRKKIDEGMAPKAMRVQLFAWSQPVSLIVLRPAPQPNDHKEVTHENVYFVSLHCRCSQFCVLRWALQRSRKSSIKTARQINLNGFFIDGPGTGHPTAQDISKQFTPNMCPGAAASEARPAYLPSPSGCR